MTRYVVESSSGFDEAALKNLDRNERRKIYEDRLAELCRVIADFSAARNNSITILERMWINTTALIETDPDTAAELAKVPGIAKVDPELRPLNRELGDRRNPGPAP